MIYCRGDKSLAWASLAAEIIDSGRRDNDTLFLSGDWCAELRELVRLAVEDTDNRVNRAAVQPNVSHGVNRRDM